MMTGMQTGLLIVLSFIVLVFCVVDLWHLKQMLKTMRHMDKNIAELVRKLSERVK